MKQQYKYKDSSFLLSSSEIKNKDLKEKVNHALLDIFKGFIPSISSDVALTFSFTDNLESFIADMEFIQHKNIKIGKNQTHFNDGELNFLIQNNEPFKILIHVEDNETFKSSLRIFNKAFKNNIELQMTTFYYRIFLLFSQLWNLENNCSYLHASAVDLNGKSVIFSADSGVGKSALLFRLSKEKGFKFIADDLTLISENTKAFFQGRCLSVKPYHLSFFPFLTEKLKTLMGSVQSLQWSIIKDDRLTFRIAPCEVFNETMEESEITSIIHLCNHNLDTFEVKDISTQKLLKYIMPIFTNEFFLAHHKLNTLASLPNSSFISSVEMLQRSEMIYSASFSNIRLRLVLVPYRSNPNDLYYFLKTEGCLN